MPKYELEELDEWNEYGEGDEGELWKGFHQALGKGDDFYEDEEWEGIN